MQLWTIACLILIPLSMTTLATTSDSPVALTITMTRIVLLPRFFEITAFYCNVERETVKSTRVPQFDYLGRG